MRYLPWPKPSTSSLPGLPYGPQKTVYISISIEDLSRDSVFFWDRGEALIITFIRDINSKIIQTKWSYSMQKSEMKKEHLIRQPRTFPQNGPK